MGVFTIFFGRLAHVPSNGLPYPWFSLCALVPWTYFAAALSAAWAVRIAVAPKIRLSARGSSAKTWRASGTTYHSMHMARSSAEVEP